MNKQSTLLRNGKNVEHDINCKELDKNNYAVALSAPNDVINQTIRDEGKFQPDIDQECQVPCGNVVWRKSQSAVADNSPRLQVIENSATCSENCKMSDVPGIYINSAEHLELSTAATPDDYPTTSKEFIHFSRRNDSKANASENPPRQCYVSDCASSSCNHIEAIGGRNDKFLKNAAINASSMFACTQIICNPLRQMVSQNRRRYQADGFNLDLTYITDRIIAMGYPANATESIYRNSMANTVKFLEYYHTGHYKVFNLRGQYIYDASKFHNRVVSFEMTDHHPPRLELMAPFCREVHDYLCADPRNVVAVHCKAGKGRTGVMICAYLCYISFYRTPRQNMDYYSIIRTHNNKGVTIPSQRRYVYYFSHLREKKLNYLPLRTELVGIYLERPPKLLGKFSKLSKGALKVRVLNGDVDVFVSSELWLSNEQISEEEELYRKYPVTIADDSYDPNCPGQTQNNCISRRCYGWTVPSTKRVFLEGDVRISLIQKSQLKVINVNQERKKVGHIWMNTMFTCPGFSGGKYVHGDEAYPINDNAIVHRVKLDTAKEHQAKTTMKSSTTTSANCREDNNQNTMINKRRRGVRSNRNPETILFDLKCRSFDNQENFSSETSKKKSSGISYSSATFSVVTNKQRLHKDNPFADSPRVTRRTSICQKCGKRARRSRTSTARRVESEPDCFSFVNDDIRKGLSSFLANRVNSGDQNAKKKRNRHEEPQNQDRPASDSTKRDCDPAERCSYASSNSSSSSIASSSTFSSSSSLDSSLLVRNGDHVQETRTKDDKTCGAVSDTCAYCSLTDDVSSRTLSMSSSIAEYQSPFSPFLQRVSKRGRELTSYGLMKNGLMEKNSREAQNYPNNSSAEELKDEEILVDEPPGLNDHCPQDSLKQIYSNESQAPRYGIVEMLKEACRRNLTPKAENKSVPVGPVVPKAQVGRPNAESQPRCLMREAEEHVGLYGIREIDKAHKNKDLDPEFKIFVVTKCLNEENAADVELANKFIDSTYHRQIDRDLKRQKKMEARHKKILQSQEEAAQIKRQSLSNNNVAEDAIASTDSAIVDSASHANFRDSGSTTSSATTTSSSTCSANNTDASISNCFENDPRLSNPRLKKYFFRQRVSSKSRHPNIHYHCPLQKPNAAICAKYSCNMDETSRSIWRTKINNDFGGVKNHAHITTECRYSPFSDRSVDSHDTLTEIDYAMKKETPRQFPDPDNVKLSDSLNKTPYISLHTNSSQRDTNCDESSPDLSSESDLCNSLRRNSVLDMKTMGNITTAEENLLFHDFQFSLAE